MKLNTVKGKTSKLIEVFIRDSSSSTGAGLTGLTSASGGLTAYYYREGAGSAVSISLVSMTLGTWTSGGFIVVDGTNMPGWYSIGIPDAALATGADSVKIHLKGAANMAPLPIEIQLVGYDPNDAVRLGLTALPNVASGSAGAIPTTGTGANQLSVAAGLVTVGTNNDKTGYGLSGAAVQAIWDALTSALTTVGSIGKLLVDNINATISSRLAPTTAGRTLDVSTTGEAGLDFDNIKDATGAHTLTNVTVPLVTTVTFVGSVTGAVGSVTGAVGSVTGNVGGNVAGSVGSLTTNNDKTGYALTTLESRVLHSGTAQAGGASTITLAAGASAADNLYRGQEIKIYGGTGAGQMAVITAYVGATKVATVDSAWSIQPDNTSTYATLDERSPKLNASLEVVAASVTGNVSGNVTGTIGDLSAPAKASVNAELIDVLTVDTYAEPAGAVAATATIKDMLNWLKVLARNKITQTSTTQTLRNDGDAGTIATSTASDDGTTFVRGKFS